MLIVVLLWLLGNAQCNMISPQFVLEPPTRVYITNSSGVTLTCAALGSPTPFITWIDVDGHQLTSIQSVREVDVNGSMWIGPDGSQSISVFRCKASNTFGTIISKSTTVTVVSLGNLQPSVEARSTRVGGVAVLECRTSSGIDNEAFSVIWTMKKTPSEPAIPLPDAGRYVYGHSGQLYLLGVTKEDSQSLFICSIFAKGVIRSLPSSKDSSTLHATSPEAPINVLDKVSTTSVPQIEDFVSTIHVTEGRPFTIPCIAHGNPTPQFSWVRDDQGSNNIIASLSTIYGMSKPYNSAMWSRGPILGCGRAKVSHKGSYSCLVANSEGSDRTSVSIGVLQELHVKIMPPLQEISAGQKAIMRCSIYGTPVSEVTWYKNGQILHPTSRIIVQNREVIISGTTEIDEGSYQCLAANSLGEAQATTSIRIRESMPLFKHKFIEQTLQPGPAVTLTCAALGHPTPSITWLRDGRSISSHTRQFSTYRLSIGSWIDPLGEVVGQVNISSVNVLDGGLYECEASNSIGRVRHRARLNVYGPPTSRLPANLTIINKLPAILPCPISGYPVTETTWMIDSRPVSPTVRRSVGADGALHITEVDAREDAKRYSCSVRNMQGLQATADFFLTVANPPVLAPLKFPDSLYEGMKLSIICSLMEGDVPVSIRWSRNGRPLSMQDQSLAQTHAQFFSNLVFNEVRGHHAGSYSCTASNSAASTTVSAVMDVKVPPQWIVEPQDIHVVAGEDFTLECHATGTPAASVTWRRAQDDSSIVDWPEITINDWRMRTVRPGTVKVRKAMPQDAGKYVCLAENGVPPAASKIILVSVLEGAEIKGRVSNETIAVNGEITLYCEAKGATPIVFSWSKNGLTLTASLSDIAINEGTSSSYVAIRTATRDHAGLYTCHAANIFGSDTKSYFVNVVENPDPPAHVHVVEVSSRSLSLAWAPPFDGNSPLTHYLVRHWPVVNGQRRAGINTTVEQERAKATITNLLPGFVYNVEVFAVNSLGTSKPSPTLSITTQKEAPSLPPTHVSVDAAKRASLTVKWKPPLAEKVRDNVEGYQIGYRKSQSQQSYNWRSVKSPSFITEIRGLEHFTSYEVVVRAINSVGAGPLTAPVVVTTQQSEPSSPPTNVECVPLSSLALRVKWNSIAKNATHGTIQGYKVFYKHLSRSAGGSDVKRTTNLETNLHGLRSHANYSIRVLAYNTAGHGQLSQTTVCSTLQDKPTAPQRIQAVTSGEHSVYVSWLEPLQPNGEITHYTLYYRPLNAHQGTVTVSIAKSSFQDLTRYEEISKEVTSLETHSHFEFWVSASTYIGEGPASKVVSQRPSKQVPAKILSFGRAVEGVLGLPVVLPCNVVGFPPPSVQWTPSTDKKENDNFLRLPLLSNHQSGNYTCTAKNVHGIHQQTWTLNVVSAPPAPQTNLLYTSEDTIDIFWSSNGDGGKEITGYEISYQKDQLNSRDLIKRLEVSASKTKYKIEQLDCGSQYILQVAAINAVGKGPTSKPVTTRTRGSAPLRPDAVDFISVNSSAITLHLYSWTSHYCPIKHFTISYRLENQQLTVKTVEGPSDVFTISNVEPLAWYEVKVVAINPSGETVASYQIATPSLTGVTLAPEVIYEVKHYDTQLSSYMSPQVLAPIVSGIACTLAVLLCVAIAISRGVCLPQKITGEDATFEPKGSLFFVKGLNHKRTASTQSLSPTARSKHNEAYKDPDDSIYTTYPYTLPLPPESSPQHNLQPNLHFETFKQQTTNEILSLPPPYGWDAIDDLPPPPPEEMTCISKDQTLLVGAPLARQWQIEADDNGTYLSKDSNNPLRSLPSQNYRMQKLECADYGFSETSSATSDPASPQINRPRSGGLNHVRRHYFPRQMSQQCSLGQPTLVKRPQNYDGVYSIDTRVDGNSDAIKPPLRPPTGFLDKQHNHRLDNRNLPKSGDYSIHV